MKTHDFDLVLELVADDYDRGCLVGGTRGRHGRSRAGGGVRRLVDVPPAAVPELKYPDLCEDCGQLAL